ncbi:MAG: DUF362 domain-containing protein [Paludibacteraceae bacterium]|nr:DUF362 domain-containing protein [Paludibacteraceae bacterium]
MKKIILMLSVFALAMSSCGDKTQKSESGATCEAQTSPCCANNKSIVYETRDLSPESIVKIYKALGREATGRIAVKISTGESEKTGYLRPNMLKPLIDTLSAVEGNTVAIVECNTAYEGTRNTTEAHWNAIKERGFLDIAKVDIMDEEGDMRIPVKDTTHIKYDIVGTHLQNYDFMINLAHFKGHQMAGLGGALKNASIGVGSSKGKAYIHTAGYTDDLATMWQHVDNQDGFVESMAAAAQAVHDYFDNGKKILYICVMYKMSIDCDCNGDPQEPLIADYGILASLDPVAVDQACYDIVSKMHNDEHNNNQPLLDRIAQQHGTHIMEWGEKIGLGSRNYELKNIDK